MSRNERLAELAEEERLQHIDDCYLLHGRSGL